MLGAAQVNPNSTVQLIVTGDWALPVREARPPTRGSDAGCDKICLATSHSTHVVICTCRKARVKVVAYANQATSLQGFLHRCRVEVGRSTRALPA